MCLLRGTDWFQVTVIIHSRLMTLADSRQRITAKSRVWYQVSSNEFMADKWDWDWFNSEHLCFPLSVSFHHSSILNFVYTLLLPDGQTGDAWELSENRRVFARKVCSLIVWKVNHNHSEQYCIPTDMTEARILEKCVSLFHYNDRYESRVQILERSRIHPHTVPSALIPTPWFTFHISTIEGRRISSQSGWPWFILTALPRGCQIHSWNTKSFCYIIRAVRSNLVCHTRHAHHVGCWRACDSGDRRLWCHYVITVFFQTLIPEIFGSLEPLAMHADRFIQCVPGTIYSEIKRPQRQTDHPPRRTPACYWRLTLQKSKRYKYLSV
jgi:hypothetical protein